MDVSFLRVFVIGCCIHTASGAYDLILSCGNSVASGGDCVMTCDTKTTTVTAILWLNGTDSQTTIDKTVDCTDAGGLPYESSCPEDGKFDLKITNATYGRDSYDWSCKNPFTGDESSATNGDTFVTVPLTKVTLKRDPPTSISCVAVSSPNATVTLYEGSPPSQDSVVKTETSYVKTLDGLETRLTSTVDESKTYYCHADNGVGPGVDSASSSQVEVYAEEWRDAAAACIGVYCGLWIIHFLIIAFWKKVHVLVLQVLHVVKILMTIATLIIGIVILALGLTATVMLVVAILAIIIALLGVLIFIFALGKAYERAGIERRHLLPGGFLAFPRQSGRKPTAEDDVEKKDEKKNVEKKKNEKKKEETDKRETVPLTTTTKAAPKTNTNQPTQPTRDLPAPQPTMKPKGGTDQKLGELRDAKRGKPPSPSPRVGHSDDDSASSLSNVSPKVEN